VFLGAGVPYARIMRELPDQVALAQASRSVGSPQIRNRGTLGGNLGTASPAGDALPALAVYDAEVVLASAAGSRQLSWRDFLVGPKRNALAPDELIVGVTWNATRGPGSFSKIGARNAMVIAIAGLCLQVDEEARGLRVALESVGPTILRAHEAEAFGAGVIEEAGAWANPRATIPASAVVRFCELTATAAIPIDDIRGTAAYRRHACAVLARRALTWALDDRRAWAS
jgi:CO/xanthine dehydrogenase FAD-binding subunit